MPKARETCTECSVRRQKCDRQTPCGRCIKRGKASVCTRNWTEHGRAGRAGRAVPAHSEHCPPSLRQNSLGHGEPRRVPTCLSNDDLERVTSTGDEITTLDFMTWKHSGPQIGAHGDLFDAKSHSTAVLQTLVPNVRLMWRLIGFHEKKLLWYHGCYHGPTFNTQVRQRLELQDAGEEDVLQLQRYDMRWAALLFAVLAGSMASAAESLLSDWGISQLEGQDLSIQWYKAATISLELGNYTSDHDITSAQAIATLTMSAHTLGFSGDLHVRLGSAMRIALSLNLHRIKSDDPDVDQASSDDSRLAILKTEIGRRLWSQLCIQDWFSIPLANAHCIHLGDFTTQRPANRDHLTMMLLDDSVPTYVSYGNYLYQIASLVAEMHNKMMSLNTDYTRYQLVIQYDARMRQLATSGRPHYFDVTVPVEDSWPHFVPWARRSLTICFAHKIMMIHRAFLKRSFTNTAFSLTRRTCVAASKTILSEAKLEQGPEEPIIWIDNAFCLAAAITLALDVCNRDPAEPEFAEHRQLVEECIQLLKDQKQSILTFRGIRLLQILLQRSSLGVGPDSGRSGANHEHFSAHASSDATPFLSMMNSSDADRSIPVEVQIARIFNPSAPEQYADQDIQHHEGLDDFLTELFPPQAGFPNAYLFEELLDVSLGR